MALCCAAGQPGLTQLKCVQPNSQRLLPDRRGHQLQRVASAWWCPQSTELFSCVSRKCCKRISWILHWNWLRVLTQLQLKGPSLPLAENYCFPADKLGPGSVCPKSCIYLVHQEAVHKGSLNCLPTSCGVSLQSGRKAVQRSKPAAPECRGSALGIEPFVFYLTESGKSENIHLFCKNWFKFLKIQKAENWRLWFMGL